MQTRTSKKFLSIYLASSVLIFAISASAIETFDGISNEYYNDINSEIETRDTITEGRCVSGSDCNQASQCSVMGMQRFSEPRCELLGDIGAPCKMFNEPENKTLSFYKKTLTCEDVYMMYCPCRANLVCDDMVCKPKPTINNDNTLKRRREKMSNRWGRWFH